jgi:hypothetical protein
VSEWSTVLSVESHRNITYLDPISLADGRVALTAVDGTGSGKFGDYDNGLVAILSSDGALLAGPTRVPSDTCGLNNARMVEFSGELVAAFSGTNYSDCTLGTPAYLLRLDVASLNPIGHDGPGLPHVDLGFDPSKSFDLAATEAGGLTMFTRDAAGAGHLSRLNVSGTSAIADDVPKPGATELADLAASENGVAWLGASQATPYATLHLGVTHGDAELLPATEIASGYGVALTTTENFPGRNLAWLGDKLVVGYLAQPAQEQQPLVALWSMTGKLLAGPVPVGVATSVLTDLLVIDGHVVVITDSAGAGVTLTRLTEQLEPVESPGGTLVVATNSGYVKVAATDGGMLLFRSAEGTGAGQEIKNSELEVARITCE